MKAAPNPTQFKSRWAILMLDWYMIIRRRDLSQIWGVQQVLMGYVASTSSARSSLKDGLHHTIPIRMKRGWSTWYRSTVTGTTPITTVWHKIQNCCIGTTAYNWIWEFEANEDGRSTWLVLLQYYEGTNSGNNEIVLANQAIPLHPQQRLFYKNEHTFLFTKHTSGF